MRHILPRRNISVYRLAIKMYRLFVIGYKMENVNSIMYVHVHALKYVITLIERN